MSRFSEDDGPDDLESLLAMGRWMGRRKAVLNGRPGLGALKSLEQALQAWPAKRLIEGGLCDGTGVCANGAWLYRHLIDNDGMSPRQAWHWLQREDKEQWDELDSWEELNRTATLVSASLGTTRTMAEVVAYENDEEAARWSRWGGQHVTPEHRYQLMLAWVQGQIIRHPLNG